MDFVSFFIKIKQKIGILAEAQARITAKPTGRSRTDGFAIKGSGQTATAIIQAQQGPLPAPARYHLCQYRPANQERKRGSRNTAKGE